MSDRNLQPFQVHLAEMHGAIGIILFSDPADYTGGDINQVYPRDWWLPPTGAQRGTVFIGDGDPLTPGYPAIGILASFISCSCRRKMIHIC